MRDLMDSPTPPHHRRIFRVLTAAVISLLGLINLIKKDIEGGNAATTSNKISDDPLVLLRGQGKELLSPVVAFTTRAEKCTDTKFLPPLDFAADVFKGQFKSQSSEDKTLLDNFCKFLHCILYDVYFFSSYLVYKRTLTQHPHSFPSQLVDYVVEHIWRWGH